MSLTVEPQARPTSVASPGRGTILIIDDDRDQCDVLAYRLKQQGYRSHTAYRGERGLAQARELDPDLILLDVRLPDLDGFSICEILADHPETSDIPIIIVSGADYGNAVREARRVGSRFYLRKPYDPNALLLLIENTIGRCHSDG